MDIREKKKIEIFCCYARKDQPLLQSLKTHLMPLQWQGLITIWSDTDINAGVEWEEEIKKLRAEAESHLRSYRKEMDKAIYEQTVQNFIARRLRETNNIPRMSLFYL